MRLIIHNIYYATLLTWVIKSSCELRDLVENDGTAFVNDDTIGCVGFYRI